MRSTGRARTAFSSLDEGNPGTAANQLGAFINEVQALGQSGQLPGALAASLVAEAQAVIASL